MIHSSPKAPPVLVALLSSALCLLPSAALAISVGKTEADTSPEAELKSFTVLDGFEVSLWASEKDGLTKPISMRWDERGRLWVITAKSYPQPEPGEIADDKVLILEDAKHSGHADKVTVFADGLRMPMGLELAPSATWPAVDRQPSADLPPKTPPPSADQPSTHRQGAADPQGSAAYIGEGEKLWIMRDLDGDGKADVREVVFSGFGTGDVHQCINSFTWTPDGALMFSQGLHCYSNVTTPWGGRRLYGAGFWMYRPLRAQLTPYPTGFPLNAWGTVYDDAGQPFSVAGAAGMFWTTPLLVPQYGDEAARSAAQAKEGNVSRVDTPSSFGIRHSAFPYSVHLIERTALPNNGQITKQGMLKYCGVDIPRNAHWPADMHGELVSGGFFENCIYRHKLSTDKANPSGYEATRQPDLIKSSSVAFRPVDVKFGPDGALYISDWYNPIIGHYQASFRHPDRDKSHGRIWRVVKKGSPVVKMADLVKARTKELLELLVGGDRWAEYQSQRLLMGRSKSEVLYAAENLAITIFNKGTRYTVCPIPMPAAERIKPDETQSEAAKAARYEQLKREELKARISYVALRANEWFEEYNRDALRISLESHSPEYLRAYATSSLAVWQPSREFKPLSYLSTMIADEDPRVRLEAIAACSHIASSETIAVALRALDARVNPMANLHVTPDGTVRSQTAPDALDKPMDSFLDRTLEAAVFGLTPQWEPALREGKLTLPPKHLAWLLDKKSDGDTLAIVRKLLKRNGIVYQPAPDGIILPNHPYSGKSPLDTDSKRALLLIPAKRGTAEDVALVLDQGFNDAVLLSELADLVEAQGIKAPANAAAVVGEASRLATGGHTQERQSTPAPNGNSTSAGESDVLRGATPRLRTTAARLIGLWKLNALAPQLKAQLYAVDSALETKSAALVALARLNAEHDLILKYSADDKQPYTVRLGAVEALSINAPAHAATAALALMPQAKTEEDMRALLAPFLAKAGRMKPLVASLTATPCSKAAADLATRALIAMGRNEPELSAALNKILGRSGVVMPYDAQWVSSLGNEATVAGNAKKGDEIFHRPALNCIACHSIGGKGGIIGPQLDAVGRGVPVELLVEAVMWPQRQIKEGYVATTVVMKDGRTVVGYKQKENATELTLRDMASNTLTTLQKSQMQTRTDAGSVMPDGLTASLSREELRDLIAYLASLGKEEKKP